MENVQKNHGKIQGKKESAERWKNLLALQLELSGCSELQCYALRYGAGKNATLIKGCIKSIGKMQWILYSLLAGKINEKDRWNTVKIKETRFLFADDVRTMCIRNNWYTRGTNTEYAHMLDTIRNRKKITTHFLYEVACDVFCHSVMDADYSINENIENIMFTLMNDCVKTCYNIID